MSKITLILMVIVLAVFLFAGLACFILGWKKGRAKLEREIEEIEKQKEKDRLYYENEKAKAKKEILNAKKNKKKSLGKGSNRERFNAVNDGLRNKD